VQEVGRRLRPDLVHRRQEADQGLVEHVAGALPPPEAAEVVEHLAGETLEPVVGELDQSIARGEVAEPELPEQPGNVPVGLWGCCHHHVLLLFRSTEVGCVSMRSPDGKRDKKSRDTGSGHRLG
jgi:hypothetical protein